MWTTPSPILVGCREDLLGDLQISTQFLYLLLEYGDHATKFSSLHVTVFIYCSLIHYVFICKISMSYLHKGCGEAVPVYKHHV